MGLPVGFWNGYLSWVDACDMSTTTKKRNALRALIMNLCLWSEAPYRDLKPTAEVAFNGTIEDMRKFIEDVFVPEFHGDRIKAYIMQRILENSKEY